MCIILLILTLIIIRLHLSNNLSAKTIKWLLILLICLPILVFICSILLTGGLDTRIQFEKGTIRYYLLLDNEIKNTPVISKNFTFGYEDDIDWQYEEHSIKFCNIENINIAKNILNNYIEEIGGTWKEDMSPIDLENSSSYFSYNVIENGCLLFSKSIKN